MGYGFCEECQEEPYCDSVCAKCNRSKTMLTANQIGSACPVKIGDTYKNGKVIYIFGDQDGYDVCTKHERIGSRSRALDLPVHREVWHRIERQ